MELRNVQLRDANSGRTVWSEDSLRRSDRERRHFIHADAPHVYKRADKQLKSVVNDMVTDLGSSRLASAQPQERTVDRAPNTLLAARRTAPSPRQTAPTRSPVSQPSPQTSQTTQKTAQTAQPTRVGVRGYFRGTPQAAPKTATAANSRANRRSN